MLKWLLTLCLAIMILGLITPWFRQRFGLGRLPGDFSCRYRGRDYFFPFTSTLLFSLLLLLVSHWL